MNVLALSDSPSGVVQVLRPFDGFENIYQGQPGSTPILFPGVKDASAGSRGYAPTLTAGYPTIVGVSLLFWFPIAIDEESGAIDYVYQLHWRLRHLTLNITPPSQPIGAPDTTSPNSTRFVIPAANDTIIYEQPEPPVGAFPAISRVLRQLYQIGDGDDPISPLLPDGTVAVLQQGIMDPASSGSASAGSPDFNTIWCDAQGDELIISVTRADPAAVWDFGGVDFAFSDLYGVGNRRETLPAVGIYLVQSPAVV